MCNSSAGNLLRANAEAFRVKVGISFSLTSFATASVVPVLIRIDAGSFQIETQVQSFSVCPSNNSLSDFEAIAA